MPQVRAQFVRQMAKKILRDCQISAPPIDLKRILSANGILYEEVDDFPDTVDALFIEDGTHIFAAVNARQHLHRQRFSLAHELGHFFLHRDISLDDPITIDAPPPDESDIGTKSPIEGEADLFAGELLVPFEMLKNHATKSLPELSKIFLVSEHVVSIAMTKHMKALFKI
jgi:Zn-dependent peptidase ImmA (M78 family)